MRYRKFGKTDLIVSELSLGTGDNAGLFIKGTRREQERAVDEALEAGVNYFDTCPDHGHGVGEFNLGEVLQKRGAHPILATLIELYRESLYDLRAAVLHSLMASRARLRVDTIDFAMIHSPVQMTVREDELDRHWMPISLDDMMGPIRGALYEAQQLGLVRYVGFATEHAEPPAVAKLLQSGMFDGANVWFNASNPSARLKYPCVAPKGHQYDGILDEVEAADAGCAVIRPLGGGALTRAALEGAVAKRHPNAGGGFTRNPDSFQREVEAARGMMSVANELGMDISEMAYRFILADPAVDTVIMGISSPDQLGETLEWMSHGPLSDDEVKKVAAAAAARG